jgi:hypothetical protein
MTFDSLRELLDRNPAAHRRAPDKPVWDVTYRLLDLPNRLRGRERRDSEALLVQALVSLSESKRPLFFESDDAFEPSDPVRDAWVQLSPRIWRARTALIAKEVSDSPLLTTYGNYSAYLRSEALLEGVPSGPWWGSRRDPSSAAEILALLRAVEVEAIITVHADASDWVAAIL